MNLPLLKNHRENVLTAILDWWKIETAHHRGAVPNERSRASVLAAWARGAGQLMPFDPVVVLSLDQRLARNAR